MSDIKRVTASAVMRVTGISTKHPKIVQWHTEQILVKQVLTMEEYVNTIGRIISSCVVDDTFVSELLDFAIDVGIVTSFTNVDLPENINDAFYVIYASDLMRAIYSVANKEQVDSIRSTSIFIAKARCANG